MFKNKATGPLEVGFELSKEQIECDEFEKKVSLLEERCQVLSDGRILSETSFYNSKAFLETLNIQIREKMEKMSDTG